MKSKPGMKQTTYRLLLTSEQRGTLRELLWMAHEHASDGFELARRVCTDEECEDESPCIDCGAWSSDVTDAEEMAELLESAEHDI